MPRSRTGISRRNRTIRWLVKRKISVMYNFEQKSIFLSDTTACMTVLAKMPIQVYLGFLGRCTLTSREFAALKNPVVETSSMLEVTCHTADAVLIE